MAGGDQSDQTYATKRDGYVRARLPEDLVNPDGIYSGMARRNAFEDGEFFPQAERGEMIKAKRKRDSVHDS